MKSEKGSKTRLDRALEAWRSDPVAGGSLSDGARAAIFDSIAEHEAMRPLSRLFAPVRRWALAGVVPLVVTLAIGAWVALQRPAATVASEASWGEVTKVGDRVVFRIANGDGEHRVLKSSRPDRFDPSGAAVVSNGSYVDRLDTDADLVFYRID